MKYIIGVDAGGTKTEAIAFSLNGEEIAKSLTGFGNLVIDFNKAVENIDYAIKNCMRALPNHELIGLYFGVASIEVGENKEKFRNIFKEKYKVNIKAYNDAELAKIALLKGEDGVITIGGTGSVSLGTHGNKKIVTGGWGHLLGDEGSGYKISIDALKVAIKEEDFGLCRSMLTENIFKYLNIKECSEIKGFVYNSSKDKIAALTPIVVDSAMKGDEKALSILATNGRELALLTESVCRRLGLVENVKVGIKGSVLTKVSFVRDEFIDYLEEKFSNIKIIQDNVSCSKGAYYEYLKEVNKQ